MRSTLEKQDNEYENSPEDAFYPDDARKMLFIPMMIVALTAFGLEATALAERNPSPVASLGAPSSSAVFVPYDGTQLNN